MMGRYYKTRNDKRKSCTISVQLLLFKGGQTATARVL